MRKLLIVYMGLAAFASENGESYGLVIGEKLYKNIFLGVAKLTRYLLNAHIGGKQRSFASFSLWADRYSFSPVPLCF